MSNDIITSNGEVIEGDLPALLDTTMASALARVEIDSQVATARNFPRSIQAAVDAIKALATLDEQTAAECVYALPRGGKTLRGPSIRLAEIIASQWGNCRDSATVVTIDRVNKLIVAEGVFHDLQTNRGTRCTVQRRISDKKGRLYNEDMIAVTGNAACSIARRNAILAGVPKGVWRKGMDAAEQVIRGDAKTLSARRETAIASLAHFGLLPDQVFAILGVKGVDDIDLDTMVTLRAIYSGLKNGETSAEELLRGTRPEAPVHKVISNPLSDNEPEPADQESGSDNSGAQVDEMPEAGEKLPATDLIIVTARARGAQAKRDGMAKRAIPPEYRAPGREAEAEAWKAGHDAEPAPAKVAE
ncbi:hypothetical protein BJ122_102219 [Rhodopseudomonas faecalis]|uniref:Uncharacterized protein n=1 Tax=Rhodopseudomonas faecalis TaxID=99655 RepID=A0A318TKQ6_9BRAD|nr:hypothetical protein [Rhodopseudomonas faecalis]PYF04993.1 hypothetical protein BJ122_102219 [Rhodopseudomonas faecalis]